jgi:hypothetical protein
MHHGVRLIDDMHHPDALHAQRIRDECPVTAPPNCLSAHYRGPKMGCNFEQLVLAVGKLRAGDIVGIAAKRRVAPCEVRGIKPSSLSSCHPEAK